MVADKVVKSFLQLPSFYAGASRLPPRVLAPGTNPAWATISTDSFLFIKILFFRPRLKILFFCLVIFLIIAYDISV